MCDSPFEIFLLPSLSSCDTYTHKTLKHMPSNWTRKNKNTLKYVGTMWLLLFFFCWRKCVKLIFIYWLLKSENWNVLIYFTHYFFRKKTLIDSCCVRCFTLCKQIIFFPPYFADLSILKWHFFPLFILLRYSRSRTKSEFFLIDFLRTDFLNVVVHISEFIKPSLEIYCTFWDKQMGKFVGSK